MFVYADPSDREGVPAFTEEAPVHLYRLDLDAIDAAESPALAMLLSSSERSRSQALRRGRHRERFVASRAMLRRILGVYLASDPASIEIDYLPFGKPYLPQGRVRFNLSHAAHHALVAVSATHRVGVDVERTDRSVDCAGIARRYFTAAERAEARVPDSNAPDIGEGEAETSFFRMWTRREALAKLSGLGFARRHRTDASEADAEADVRLVSFVPVAGTVATLAAVPDPRAGE